MKKVLAISGSTRQNSTNSNYIKAIAELCKNEFTIILFEDIADLPHFNPDDNNEQVAAAVLHFRSLLAAADAILICTPEYAHGVPGSLKNAIDWTVSSNEFYRKPTALITASTDGSYGHKALLETLKVIEAKGIEQNQLLISFAKTKINSNHQITDEATLTALKIMLKNFEQTISEA
jgi:NAD(P)H-dependent FMN reductase